MLSIENNYSLQSAAQHLKRETYPYKQQLNIVDNKTIKHVIRQKYLSHKIDN